MIHTRILRVPVAPPEVFPHGYPIEDGSAVPIYHAPGKEIIAQARPLAYRGDRLDLCALTWEQPDGEQPIEPEPTWGQAYKVPVAECVAKHAVGIQRFTEDYPLDELASAMIGPVFCYAELRRSSTRYWAAVSKESTYSLGLVRNAHSVDGPIHDGFPDPQRLSVNDLNDRFIAPAPLTIGPIPLPASLTVEADYPESSAYGSPYGAQGGGDGINPWGLYKNQRMTLAQSVEFLRRRGTGALYDHGGPIKELPAGAKYHLDGPSDPGVCFGWPSDGDPLNWRGQDYSNTTHGVTDSQHLCRVLGALYPQAYRGAWWAINELRCLAQTIVLCYPPAKRTRMGREDGWRMHAVAAAIHLTSPKDPMREGWVAWGTDMIGRADQLTDDNEPIDIQWDHGQLPAYGYAIGKGYGLSAPWECLILLSGTVALRAVFPKIAFAWDYFDMAGLSGQFMESWDPSSSGWHYKAVWSLPKIGNGQVSVAKWIPDDNGDESQEHYLGALGLLFMPQLTVVDLAGTQVCKDAIAQLTAWAAKKGKPLAECFPVTGSEDAWGWNVIARMAMEAAGGEI